MLFVDTEKKNHEYPKLMDLKSNKSLAFLVAVAIVLLPFRFGHAMAETDSAGSDQSIIVHLGQDCTHGAISHHPHHCAEHAPDANSFDECCGDQCAGTQVLISSSFDFKFPVTQQFNPLWLKPMPEILAFVKYRPPIFLS